MREPGFYWVKNDRGVWYIAEFYTDDEGNPGWLCVYNQNEFNDSDFTEIDERRIVRQYPGLTEDEKTNISEFVRSRTTSEGILGL